MNRPQPAGLVTAGRRLLAGGVCVLALLFVSGCATPALKTVGLDEWMRKAQRSVLLDRKPSEHTMRYLRYRQLDGALRSNPEELIARLGEAVDSAPDRDTLFALSELCYLRAKTMARRSERRQPYYLASARYSYACLFDSDAGLHLSEFDPRFRLACDFYNRSLAALFPEPLAGAALHGDGRVTVALPSHTLEIIAPRDSAIRLEDLDQDSLAYRYDATAFATQNRRFGLGVPMIAQRATDQSTVGKKVVLTRSVSHVTAATVLLEFRGRPESQGPGTTTEQAYLRVFDPVTTPEVDLGGRRVPLEADLSTPLAFLLESNRELTGLKGMLRKLQGDIMSARRGLFMMQPYQPGKIPVLFVHGLMSDPGTWLPMLNELIYDPGLTAHYQFWFFFYPTSNPVLISAAELRESLRWTRDELDPDHKDATLDQMVIVGHSMGGLLTRLMIQRTETSLVESCMGVGVDDLAVGDDERAVLRELDTFRPLPFVARVVFMATPHRGADMARGLVGRIGDMLSAPAKYVLTSLDATLHAIGMGKKNLPSGIDNLRVDGRFVKILDSLPMSPDVPVHSIIGNKKKAGVAGGSDGVVDYTSSHLDSAVSEKIVKSGHNVQKTAEGIREVRRILLLHRDESQ